MCSRSLIVAYIIAFAPLVRAQCDSTPPRLLPAFTMHGDSAGEQFGQWTYVIHDSTGKPEIVISSSGTEFAMRVYSRFASATDTSYRCCLPYTEVHECHVTSSRFPDYVVHEDIAGKGDSLFLIPGSPEGIWSQRKQLLMINALHAHIVVGKFFEPDRDAIVIGNFSARGGGKPGVPGGIFVWRGRDSLTTTPDTVIWGDANTLKTNYVYLGSTLGAVAVVGDSSSTPMALSGGDAGSHFHEMNAFTGGAGFPAYRQRWTDDPFARGWYYEDGVPFGIADVTHDGVAEFHAMSYVSKDTVWGAARSGNRDFVYHPWRPFDTVEYVRWRPPDAPSRVCIPNISGFGGPVVDLGDINGSGEPAIAVGAGGSFHGAGAVVIYMGGKHFDTLPDAYFAGVQLSHASQVVGGFDFNNDGLMDFAVPMPADDGVGGTNNPAGQVAFIAGSRALRNIGVNAVRDPLGVEPVSAALNISPHPVREWAHITLQLPVEFTEHDDARIELRDIVGRTVASAPANEYVRGNQVSIDCTGMPTGLYTAVARVGRKVYARRFIHEK